ncbi:SMI1/KNR4 family protein [Streptomyces phaeochromogenes]|uniref:SMI1/KNR4 family protein n=1 Tax=Streptomyces phaeochromogenes TaxID=1923 RepID=UPI002E297EE3|nr:SMI1/KNR4 family protein [Streptomyces phaeochromogenes]
MTSSIAASWAQITTVLQNQAPVTARCLRPPASSTELAGAEAVLGFSLPEQLHEWLLLADGLEVRPEAGRLLPPMFVPVGFRRMVQLWKLKMDIGNDGKPEGTPQAGMPQRGFSERFVPLGDDTTGDLLVVDMRPGNQQGCVLHWSMVDGVCGPAYWPDVAQMWRDVAEALQTGETEDVFSDDDPHLTSNGCSAVFTSSGMLDWRF